MFFYRIYLFHHIHHKCSAVLAVPMYFSVSVVWYCTLQEQGAIVFIVILTSVGLNSVATIVIESLKFECQAPRNIFMYIQGCDKQTIVK
jgi:hypothetical protein